MTKKVCGEELFVSLEALISACRKEANWEKEREEKILYKLTNKHSNF